MRLATFVPPVLGVFALILASCSQPTSVSVLAEEAKDAATSLALFGETPARNSVNLTDRSVRDDFVLRPKGKEKHVKWSVQVGTQAFGGPVIAGGKVFVGTNNERPRDRSLKGDLGVLMCFRASDGQFLWQITHEKLPNTGSNDWPQMGVASTPCVEGDRIYYVSNRAELVCADVNGDEKTGKGKIVWSFDMIKETDVYPCYLANSSPLVVGDLVYALTGNGTDPNTAKLEKPDAPSLVAVNKKTGKLAWKCNRPGARVIRAQWSSPAAATVNGRTQVVYGGGDGYMYGLDAKTGDLIWKFNCNPTKVTPYKVGGGGQQCFIVATPVIHDNKCYIAMGQEPDDGPGVGHLWCIDISKEPANKEKDLSPVGDNFDPKAPVNKDSGLVWHHGGPAPKGGDREYVFSRTISTVAIHDGLVYAPELAGYLQCLDAKTGEKYWEYDFQESTWCSPYYVDGKLFVGTDSGDLYVFKPGKKMSEPKKIQTGGTVKVPPVSRDNVLYVNNGANVIAIEPRK